jgi:hypothetical protein
LKISLNGANVFVILLLFLIDVFVPKCCESGLVLKGKQMKFKFLIYILLSAACLFGGYANAGLIVDTADDSFIDTTTGLEWMDFGVNNSYSYNEVSELLATTFSEWRLATEAEVVSLWRTAFASDSYFTDVREITTVLYENYWAYNDLFGTSLYDLTFDIMGLSSQNSVQYGMFATAEGNLGIASFSDYDLDSARSDLASIAIDQGGWHYSGDTNREESNTFLIRRFVQTVPEPSTLSIFALSLISLVLRRFKKQS